MEKSALEVIIPTGSRDRKCQSFNQSIIYSLLITSLVIPPPHCASAGDKRDNIVDMDLWSLLFRTCYGPVTQRNYWECSSCTYSPPANTPQSLYQSSDLGGTSGWSERRRDSRQRQIRWNIPSPSPRTHMRALGCVDYNTPFGVRHVLIQITYWED